MTGPSTVNFKVLCPDLKEHSACTTDSEAMMDLDLRQLNYDQWLRFVFDHPVTRIEDAWHFDIEYAADHDQVLANCTQMFLKSKVLIGSFNAEQLEQGFWFIPGPNGFMRFLADEDVPWSRRQACIQSIESLFRECFSVMPPWMTSCYMWWDSYVSYCAFGNNELMTDERLLDETFRVLQAILKQPEHCRRSAVHGLQHLEALDTPLRQQVQAVLNGVAKM